MCACCRHAGCVHVSGLQGAFDAFAMGNFPFASDYMSGEGQGELPAWPMRAACERMSSLAPSAHRPKTNNHHHSTHTTPQLLSKLMQLGRKGLQRTTAEGGRRTQAGRASVAEPATAGGHVYDGAGLLDRLASAASILYNASGTASCFSLELAGPAAGSVGEL